MKHRRKEFYRFAVESVRKWAVPAALLIVALLLSGCNLQGGTEKGGPVSDDDGPGNIEELLLEIATGVGEIQGCLDGGMKIMVTGEMESGDVSAPLAALETEHYDLFVREVYQTVDPYGREIYRCALLTDRGEEPTGD